MSCEAPLQPADLPPSTYLSSAFVQRHIPERAATALGEDAARVIPYAIMSGCDIRTFPYAYPRRAWRDSVVHHPDTLQTLSEPFAAVALAVAVSSGIVWRGPEGTFTVPNGRVQAEMTRLFELYCAIGTDYLG